MPEGKVFLDPDLRRTRCRLEVQPVATAAGDYSIQSVERHGS